MTDYTPIDCALYSEFELTIVQGRRLRISWTDEHGQLCMDVFMPQDLVTRDRAEFLVGNRADGTCLELRLDRIIRSEPL